MDVERDEVLSIDDIASISREASSAIHRFVSCGKVLERICTHPLFFNRR
jgi:hypothetical protein